MQLRIFSEPHRGATFDTELRFVQAVEACGFDGYFRADHYQSMGDSPGMPGPTDAWISLAALTQQTTRISLGTLVTSATFRLPGSLAILVAQVDQMSRGRIELGIGTGWYEREHVSYGIPFPPLRERFARLEEQLQIVTQLWRTPSAERFTFSGEFYQLFDSPALPKPFRPSGPPIIIGGRGVRRTPEIAVRYADEFNGVFQTFEDASRQFELVTKLAEREGRTANTWPLTLSIGIVVACGRTQAEANSRAQQMYEHNSALPPEDPIIGTPDQVIDRIMKFASIGVERVYLRLPDMVDTDHVELIAGTILPQVSSHHPGARPD